MARGKDLRPAHPCPGCGRMVVRDQAHRCPRRRGQCRDCGLTRQLDGSGHCTACAAMPYRSLIGGIPRPPEPERADLLAYYSSRAEAGLGLFSDPAGRIAFVWAMAEQRAAASAATGQNAQTFLTALCRETKRALERVEPVRTRD